MQKERIIFQMYPTWKCNFKCPYCITSDCPPDDISMFDDHSIDEWIEALCAFGEEYDIELSLCGGDPLVLENTFIMLEKLIQLPAVKYIRLDHNMSKVKMLVERIPSSKIQVNGSWHPLFMNFNRLYESAKMLKERDMLAMINFVASEDNLRYLSEHQLNLPEIVKRLDEEGLFINVATDIHRRSDKAYIEAYKPYIAPRDWDYLVGDMPSIGVPCEAAKNYFMVEWDGVITTCIGLETPASQIKQGRNVVGSFFEHRLERKKIHCGVSCPNCIVMYVNRADNAFPTAEHLKGYRERTWQWRNAYRTLHETK